MKYQDYVMNIMASCMTLDESEGARTNGYFISVSGTKERKHLTNWKPFGINFRYRHQVYNLNNWRHTPISLERTRTAK